MMTEKRSKFWFLFVVGMLLTIYLFFPKWEVYALAPGDYCPTCGDRKSVV